jgi:hypothetical protein
MGIDMIAGERKLNESTHHSRERRAADRRDRFAALMLYGRSATANRVRETLISSAGQGNWGGVQPPSSRYFALSEGEEYAYCTRPCPLRENRLPFIPDL